VPRQRPPANDKKNVPNARRSRRRADDAVITLRLVLQLDRVPYLPQ
jgi:hypothetical protein